MSSTFRPGDWTCRECGNHNFASRLTCKQCDKPAHAKEDYMRPGDWHCKCGAFNYAKRETCMNECGAVKPAKVREVLKKSDVVKEAAADDDDNGTAEESASPPKRARKIAASSTLDEEDLTLSSLPSVNPALALRIIDITNPAEPVEYYLTVDIERIGADFKYGILAIGLIFGKSNGQILAKRAFCAHVPPIDEFDQTCYNEFWVNYPQVLERIEKEAVVNPIAQFHAFLLQLEDKYGPFGRTNKHRVNMKLVSDNPAYDIGMINLEFFKYGLPKPMAEMWRGGYVPTDDPSEQIRGLTRAQKDKVESFITAKHTHFPTEDAEKIYQQRCGIRAVLGS